MDDQPRIVLAFLPPIKRNALSDFLHSLFKKTDIIDIDSMLKKTLRENNMQEVVSKHTRKELQDAWYEAVKSAFVLLNNSSHENQVKIIIAHAMYYKIVNREFFSVFDAAYLKKSADNNNPKMRISHTLLIIDDLYDILSRLNRNNELYSEAALSSFLEDYCSVLKLKVSAVQNKPEAYLSWLHYRINSLLTWRAQEILLAQNIATQLNSKFMLWGLKQDPSVLNKWVQTDDKIFYVSHPISDPRRHYNKHHQWPSIVNTINNLQVDLAKKKIYTVMPTALDEFRFEKHNHKYTSKLTARWPVPSIVKRQFKRFDLLDSDVNYHKIMMPNKIKFKPDQFAINQLIPVNVSSVQSQVDSIFNSIEMMIQESLSNRDHTIVWHSDGIIVIEPYSLDKGELHGGVEKELTYLRVVNDSIKASPSSVNQQTRKLFGIFLRSTIQKMIMDEQFKNKWVYYLRKITCETERIDQSNGDKIIDDNGKQKSTQSSLGRRVIDNTTYASIKQHLPEYSRQAIAMTFLNRALAMTQDVEYLTVLFINKYADLRKRDTIKKIYDFFHDDKSLNWKDELIKIAEEEGLI